MRIRRKVLLTTLGVLAVIVLGAQFIRPALPNPPVTADLNAPPDVKQILTTACYNCHSNETKLAVFDEVVPAYWLVAKDVKAARKHLNFSEFAKVAPAQQQEMLFEMVNHIQFGVMPPRSYQLLHRDSKITDEKLAVIKSYLDPYRTRAAASSDQFAAVEGEYNKWVHGGQTVGAVKPTLNGIAFIPEYKDWRVIGTSERFDNQSIRLVLGNEVAIRAVQTNQINPWPDGTIFAKVAWDRLTDANGAVHPGQFKQVEFMIKDSQKYASTLGWGFARWRGANLQPFGSDANFAQGCVGCHMPMQPNDFVFTMPIKGGR